MNLTAIEFARILKRTVTDPIVAAINGLRPKDSPIINVYVNGTLDPQDVEQQVRAALRAGSLGGIH
jgi:hypothetical protein